MHIHDNRLIAKCPFYDFKEMLEHKNVKAWLKYVSAFANTEGGSLFYGINDDGGIVGLENPQADADFINEMMLPTQVDDNKNSFVILANTYREQTHQKWNDKYWESFGLVTSDGKLTNAGLLFIVNWLNGIQIQDRDIYKVPSMSRNPIIADMFTQLDYMEKRGSGLRKIRKFMEKLPIFLSDKEPQYQIEATSFYITFYMNWGKNERIPIEEVLNKVNNSLEKYSLYEESSVKTFGDLQKSSVKQKRLGRIAQSILDLVISNGFISQDKMAEK